MYLRRLHVEHLGDASLHDKEVRVVDVELHGAKQVLYPRGLGQAAVEQVLVTTAYHNLQMTPER